MKGRKSFTEIEAEQIKILIAKKLLATPDKQKGIRDKVRKIGFYFSDFISKKDGYTVEDFEGLIRSETVVINGNNIQPILSTTVPEPIEPPISLKNRNNTSPQHYKISFEALIDNNTEVLILGSMPGERSLTLGEYYAHSGNRFWKIIAKITNDRIPTSYEDKLNLLSKHKIGLWDVAKIAQRNGSLDSNMSDEIPNDLDRLLENHPKIRVIGFNGTKAAILFKKFFKPKPHIAYQNLSSTSGANTSITLEQSCNDWKRILK